MIRTIKATDAVREFSEILNSVKYRADRFTIIRGGKPVAAIVPVESAQAGRTLKELRMIIKSLPRLGDDSEQFARDVEEIAHLQPAMPGESQWE